MRLLALALVLTACRAKDADPVDSSVDVNPIDEDGDGVPAEEDCDDNDAAVFPGAEEVCDGLDNDCDGEVDVGAVDAGTYFADADGDGYGDDASAAEACEPPEGSAEAGGDCDDDDPAYYPGAAEDDCTDPNDYNCDGSVGFADNDGDGYAACEECDDGDRAVNPSATEVCDGLDNDCDGETDVDAVDAQTWYVDADADGYGDVDFAEQACEPPERYADNPDDCDDAAGDVNPGADERCGGLDEDCDGQVDEASAADAATWYVDADSDGYGNSDYSQDACEQPSGYVDNPDDCDDGEALAWSGAAELCDAVDNDCDGGVDEGVTNTWYADSDGDGYGNARYRQDACDQPSGYADNPDDCDDGEGAVNPAAAEVCNALDDDCDGLIDDDDGDLDLSTGDTFYADSDGDGYGDASASLLACEAPSGGVEDDSDCDDAEATTNPGAAELCDGVDNDCDGALDSGLLGSDTTCAAVSCDAILSDGSSIGDGPYYLDPEGDGGAELYTCDMSTDGGGWTLVARWNRIDDGEDLSALQSHLTQDFDNMTTYVERSTSLEWADDDGTADVMAYSRDVPVPNGGEVLFEVEARGTSMEDSGLWLYAVAGGSDADLACQGVDDQDCSSSNTASYTDAEYAYVPDYTCADTASGTFTLSEDYQSDLGAQITSFHLRSMMCDLYGDYVNLYNFELWVR